MFKTTFQATLTTALSALLIGLTGAAHAQTQTVEISAAALRAVNEHEADDLKGLYQMSDGRMMRLSYRAGAIVVDLEGEPVAQLRAVSSRQLRSTDGRMQMRFEVGAWPGQTDVTVTLLKGETVARLSSATTQR